MSSLSPNTSYVCDTLPAARLASDDDICASPSHREQSLSMDDSEQLMSFEVAPDTDTDDTIGIPPSPKPHESGSPPPSWQPPPRKLCPRHQRMADEGTNLRLQQSLDALPVEEREAVNAFWSNFSQSSHPKRAIILHGLLTMCCFSQLSLLSEQLAYLIRLDPFSVLPREVSLKILGHLDATSLCRAAQVSKGWRMLADDNILWRGICEQHIGTKCRNCGWGLPILEKKRNFRMVSDSPCPSPSVPAASLTSEDYASSVERPLKRHRPGLSPDPHAPTAAASRRSDSPSRSLVATDSPLPPSVPLTRPWKDVYSERLTVERNWRKGKCTIRTLKGHTDGVMCLQFNENLSHPSFPVLITGSYDCTIRVWNMETGVELHCLKGHTRVVRALQFDEVKLITGSMDHTLRVWDWRRNKCIRTLTGHTEGVVCLNFDSDVLASGSVDATIKVWNLRTGGAFTLRGHRDWVNSVLLWDSDQNLRASSSTPLVPDSMSSRSASCSSQISPGKLLFSASDDGTIRLWELTSRICVRQFTGHVGQVQSIKLLMLDEGDKPMPPAHDEEDTANHADSASSITSLMPPQPPASPTSSFEAVTAAVHTNAVTAQCVEPPKRTKPLLVSGSLDNTIKLWDIDKSDTLKTFFGHIQGVWAVAGDKLRLVSGSHDRTIKAGFKSLVLPILGAEQIGIGMVPRG